MRTAATPRSEDDLATLRRDYASQSLAQMADQLGRSQSSVRLRASLEGLQKKRGRPANVAVRGPYYRSGSDAERDTLRAMFPIEPIALIARTLGRTQGEIWSQARELKLVRDVHPIV